MSELSTREWHAQFARQARWTGATRNQLYRRAKLLYAERVLDVGCGTGAITCELARRTRGEVIGLDIDPSMLAFARQQDRDTHYEEGDALAMPYPDRYFDVVTCHFVLLWVSDPLRVVCEMARVTRVQGCVLICAEPDYGGRLDWPKLPIREWQIEGLRRQGAHPTIGRQLRQLLVQAGLHTEVGVIPSHWDSQSLRENFDAEWAFLRRDAEEAVGTPAFAQVKDQARAASDAGTRTVYLPTFYAFGRKR